MTPLNLATVFVCEMTARKLAISQFFRRSHSRHERIQRVGVRPVGFAYVGDYRLHPEDTFDADWECPIAINNGAERLTYPSSYVSRRASRMWRLKVPEISMFRWLLAAGLYRI
jgi:hypothetical protein